MCANIFRRVVAATFLVTLIFFQGTETRAAVVVIDGLGRATAINALTVGVTTYDIDFVFGSYRSVFPGGDLFPNAGDIANAAIIELNSVSVSFVDVGMESDFFLPRVFLPPNFPGLLVSNQAGFREFRSIFGGGEMDSAL